MPVTDAAAFSFCCTFYACGTQQGFEDCLAFALSISAFSGDPIRVLA